MTKERVSERLEEGEKKRAMKSWKKRRKGEQGKKQKRKGKERRRQKRERNNQWDLAGMRNH